MNSQEFAAKVRTKYPGAYDSIDDDTLTQKVLAKYPEYASSVDSPSSEGPGVLESAALGAMSGVPFAQTAVSGIQAMSPNKTYEEAHKELETAKDKAWETHPVAYGGGKTAGLIGTALVAPEGLVGAVATGAGYGLDTSAKPEDMIKDAAIGSAGGAVLHGVGKTIINPMIEKVFPAVGKRAVASLGAPTLDDVNAYLKNPEAIRSALSNTQMAEKLAMTTDDIGKAAGHLSGEAVENLSKTTKPILSFPEGKYSLSDNLKPIFEETSSRYLTNGLPATAADETAIKALQGQYSRLAEIADANGGAIPETTLKEVIQKLQGSINQNTWGNPEASAAQDAMKNLSGKLNSILKESNPQYAEAMKPVANLAELKSNLTGKFGMETAPGGVVSATEATNTKMGSVLKEGKTESQDYLSKLKDETGIDFLEMARNAKIKGAFEKEGSAAGMNTMTHAAGYGLGRLTGLPGGGLIGSLIGGVVGHNIDGGHVAKSILDMYLKGADNAALKTYGPILIKAAKQGGNALAATHFVLSTSHPEYQKLVQEAQGQPQE